MVGASGETDQEILAIYSHMIAYGLYLPDYPIGHIIAFQVADDVLDYTGAGESQGQRAGADVAEGEARLRVVMASGGAEATPAGWMPGEIVLKPGFDDLPKRVERGTSPAAPP